MLDLDSGDLSTLAEEPTSDLLGPRLAADGTLFFIRRPYETGPGRVSPLGILKDAVLFPFRMSYAIFQFFNFFSMRYSGKPLTTAKGGAQRQPDLKQMMILGNLMDTGKAAQGADRSDAEAPSMVPASWQLIRRAAAGAAPGETVARGVLSFDISPDGDVCYSNGNAVYVLNG